MMRELIGIWIAAFLTLCLLSFLYKDNPFFRFAEALFAGVSLGYYIGQTANQTIKPNLVVPLVHDFAHNWDLIIPLLIGLNLYTRYIPKTPGWRACRSRSTSATTSASTWCRSCTARSCRRWRTRSCR